MLPYGDLYKELTKYQCKTLENVLSLAWAEVKWEEDVASRAKAQQKQDPKTIRPDRTEQDEKPSQRPARDSGNRNRGRYQNRPIEKTGGMAVSMWPNISHLSVSRSELINALRQMGQQVKWPQKMKSPDSFRNHGFWWKGHLREFLSENAKSHLSKETMGKPTKAAPVSPPRQDRVIHVISGGSEISGISHAAAKKSTRNAKHGLEAAKPKRLLLGTDEISFTAKEQEKVLTPHHDALVISLTVANCLVKRILVDNGSSGNIIFQAAYKDLGMEEGALTRRVTPLIDHSEGKDQGLIAITEQASGSSHQGTGEWIPHVDGSNNVRGAAVLSIPLLVLQWPATMEEPPSEEVSAVKEGETWMTPLIRYAVSLVGRSCSCLIVGRPAHDTCSRYLEVGLWQEAKSNLVTVTLGKDDWIAWCWTLGPPE
ncbi:hypothetical protein DY000_02042182 [Brassica cretica]|uniref:Uncharacterized protein n=1 Tax=Brassica cretica TaxID=69181 RepID=A0ABQ7BA61_BRACR|nr:hypothetical protein DY000_02042182 [Brassica cretica]